MVRMIAGSQRNHESVTSKTRNFLLRYSVTSYTSQAAKPKKRSSVPNPTKDVPANEPQAPDEGAEANAATPAGHA